MADKKRVFVSSVQKELELERAAVAHLIATDPFLLHHCIPVLFEKEPAPARPASKPYLDSLRSCSIYVLLIAKEYGQPDGDLSAMHHEYRLAQKMKLPTIVFLKGKEDGARLPETLDLISEVKKAGHTYKRFHDREDLKPEILRTLMRTLEDEFGIKATSAEVSEGEHLIEAASAFETAVLRDVDVKTLEKSLIESFRQQTAQIDKKPNKYSNEVTLHACGLAIRSDKENVYYATAAAFILFGSHPAHRFPQCEILVDAYDNIRITGQPKDQLNVNSPLPYALDQVLKFIDEHTFHPRRVVGLNNVRLDEYPVAALREALLNAVAHRIYDDASRKVFVRIFSNRIEIASPGYPPKPLTLAKLRKGGYRPCSRNPLIAQTLAVLDKMEQRGSGFARMHDAMLNHGLDKPTIDQQDGFFIVTLPGPSGNYDRIKPPSNVTGPITPAMEARLNKRQKSIIRRVQENGTVTSGWCRKKLGITYDTANRDLLDLVTAGLLERIGSGRSTRFQIKEARS